MDAVGLWSCSWDLIQVRDFQALQNLKDRPWLVEIIVHYDWLVSRNKLLLIKHNIPILTRYHVSIMP